MKLPLKIKDDISLVTAGLIVAIMVILATFFRMVNFSLIIPLLLLFAGLHLLFLKRADYKILINLGFLLTLIIFVSHTFLEYFELSDWYIPTASIAMLTVLLYKDLHLAYLMSFMSSTLVALIVGGGLDMMLVFFIGGLTGAYAIREARTRSHLMYAGLFIGIMQLVSIVLLIPEWEFILTKMFVTEYVQKLFVNGLISAIVVMATSKIFESLFGVITNFTLLELSDFNHPLLKRMMLEAAGTYNHSLNVAILSESAADSIEADALLTRVGSYYHDIGKMIKPEYFVENQLVDGNKHDEIEPSMSRLVILNHVKEGIEMAKKNKLNEKIIQFIPQHHGTGLIYYFYQKALEGAETEQEVEEENFRYPGPKPQTRETAIVMLADSVEGAARTLEDPNPTRIEELVRKIINNRFIDGQLDECPLTLKEIDKISQTFTRVLGATLHGRIKYPEKKNGNANNSSKSPETGSNQPNQNQKNSKKDSSS